MSDIFRVFRKSIEQVLVSDKERGLYKNIPDDWGGVELDAIVKRRNSMAESTENSEDRNTRTSIHFRFKDADHVKVGYYVSLDGGWRTIEEVIDGKDFHQGKSKFILVRLGDEILPNEDNEPSWSDVISA